MNILTNIFVGEVRSPKSEVRSPKMRSPALCGINSATNRLRRAEELGEATQFRDSGTEEKKLYALRFTLYASCSEPCALCSLPSAPNLRPDVAGLRLTKSAPSF